MFSRQFGSGPDVVVGLHGWGGNHRTFDPLEALRPDSATLFVVDLPGYGQSLSPQTWTLRRIAEEVQDHLTARVVRPFTLVGNCSGAIVGLHLAQLMPERIKRFILIDPFAYVPWYFKVFLLGEFGRRAYSTTFQTSFGRRITNSALRGQRNASTDLTASFESVNHETTYRYLKLMDEIGDFRTFAGIDVPIVLAYGERTFGAVKKSIQYWKSIWPQAVVHELRGAGHLPIEEAPQELAALAFQGKRRNGHP
jgi:pimeloyl-ACP methyl ester carboxylesterase